MRMQSARKGDIVRIAGDPSLWILSDRIDLKRWKAHLPTRPNTTVLTSHEVEALWRRAKG